MFTRLLTNHACRPGRPRRRPGHARRQGHRQHRAHGCATGQRRVGKGRNTKGCLAAVQHAPSCLPPRPQLQVCALLPFVAPAVVCTIHQPSLEIFEAFQELLLLKVRRRSMLHGTNA